ncbi:carboxylesterase/lipase family protein [Mucilaginibacter ginkgonis]|uniref:Carboxylic ester hydrolase n=1 Tax=Mucilaginibacter ginkgonis TaxID=2682091 RepID=A0A6I4I2K3_9SPHI|nr:carboxylesterase family protein [Mucilaginibacter ginkgonis]QQL50743.1 carboxylesterase family protein [Mucilaginibacter ginkgonis]
MRTKITYSLAAALLCAATAFAQPTVKVQNGTLEGISLPKSNITVYLGVPFAKPPLGDLRWREPQPAANWAGVRKADHFAGQAMQGRVFADMVFRSSGITEDCLYLNVWTPAKTSAAKLPVLVYFYGGGLVGGDGSEPRYDGESMATKGIVAVTVNYRLGIFGFFSHPELTKESPHHASGNYGYLDQSAAVQWVKHNIAAFGGDPDKITIAGESAGSISTAAQMASPLTRNLIAGAIGESGAPFKPTLAPMPLVDCEKLGEAFAAKEGVSTLADLRAIPADKLLADASKPGYFRMSTAIDGYFLPKSPNDIYAAGEQAHVPLLAGWNSAEVPFQALMGNDAPSPANYEKTVKGLYPNNAGEVLMLYPGKDTAQVITSATALASDRFIVYSTWKWLDESAKTGGKPVYRYLFSKMRPAMVNPGPVKPGKYPPAGASHASEIEYALGNLAGNNVYAWTADDEKASATMEEYFANFIKTGNPNGKGLPKWPAVKPGVPAQYININANTKAETETTRNRYLFLDKQYVK